LYPASGEGTHLFVTIEKRGLTTQDAVRDIARLLGLAPREIGYAGQKDAQAVTRQRLSVEHLDEARVRALRHGRLRVIGIERHGNKLKLGHLAGNRFKIKVRGLPAERVGDARAVLERLARAGVPNYFGPQRFGLRGDSWSVGRALLHEDFEEALAVFAGRASEVDRGTVLQARKLFDAGDYERAAKAWPRGFRDSLRAVGTLARTRDFKRAVLAIDRNLLRFLVSSYQSWLFNNVLAERIASLDHVLTGDLAHKEDNGAIFLVEDVALEAPRAERFEISATGPLFGKRMSATSGEPARIEAFVLGKAGETAQAFESGPWQPTGGRRPLRFKIAELEFDTGSDDHGDFARLAFVLPPGCYATSVLAEINKQPPSDG
ncbi:MAG TPA: tRNA pseudouridine(13) synthase TruD, partial [Planctomycetota bacterium]|nr:tRNA pseudouridine(13) synthase TruD [Planctomycetota bacterium]